MFVFCVRRDHDPGIAGGAGHGLVGAGVRRVGAARAALLPDPAHGAHGPARRHLETARLRRLRTSTGKIHHVPYFYFLFFFVPQ